MKNRIAGMLGAAALALFAVGALAGGNELMYIPIQQLPTVAPSAVNGALDYTPVYQASTGQTVKVLAQGTSTGVAPVTLAVTTALDSTYCGKTVLMSGAGSARTFTLPAATGTGCSLNLTVLAVNTSNYVITHAGSDVIKGGLLFSGDNASNAVTGFETQTAVTITLNGTTTGGAGIGDSIELKDIGAGLWRINGRVTESGAEATPFS